MKTILISIVVGALVTEPEESSNSYKCRVARVAFARRRRNSIGRSLFVEIFYTNLQLKDGLGMEFTAC